MPNWDLRKPAAFDLTAASPLNQSILTEACVTAGSSAQVSERRKHASNDVKCSELGWSCISLAAETYGCWGAGALLHLSCLASWLATRLQISCHLNTLWYAQPGSCQSKCKGTAILSIWHQLWHHSSTTIG